jgi:tripartite-type tricarboxylate transporter receptor subunit TctC
MAYGVTPVLSIMFRSFLAVITLALVLPSNGRADSWPQRPITLIHGFGAGGNADSISRLVAAALSESLGVSVVVDAKPGAGGNIALTTFNR